MGTGRVAGLSQAIVRDSVGPFGHLKGPNAKSFDPLNRLGFDFKRRADAEFPFEAYTRSRYDFRLWRRRRTDSKLITVVLWPQHPSRAPMTDVGYWRQLGEEFVSKVVSRDSAVASPPLPASN